jgi:hypothetical protein
MAKGSSYGGDGEPSSIIPVSAKVPPRASAVQDTPPVAAEAGAQAGRQQATTRRVTTKRVPIKPDVEEEQQQAPARRPATRKVAGAAVFEEEQVAPTQRAQAGRRVTPANGGSSGSRKAPVTRVVNEYPTDPPHPLTRHNSWLRLFALSAGVVLVGAIILITAGLYLRGPSNPQLMNYNSQSFPIELGGSSSAFNLWNNSTGPIPAKTAIPTEPAGSYTVLGKPTITANFINEVLSSYNSPTAGLGQDLYNLGVQYGIDPVYALAFFMHESLFGTTGEARATLSLGNERCIQDRPCINTAGTTCQTGQSCYAKMNSWQDGFEEWYKLIRNLYVAQWGLVTVDEIIPKYAPNSDGNDEAAYIAAIKNTVDTWRAGTVRIS